MESCENCGRAIGKLETPRVHENHIVCAECWQRLRPEPVSDVMVVQQTPATVRAAPPQVVVVQAPRAVSPVIAPPPPQVQTIELTGKRWKGMMLLGSLAAIAGTVMLCAGVGNHNPAIGVFGAMLLVGGLIVSIIARIGAWWYHG